MGKGKREKSPVETDKTSLKLDENSGETPRNPGTQKLKRKEIPGNLQCYILIFLTNYKYIWDFFPPRNPTSLVFWKILDIFGMPKYTWKIQIMYFWDIFFQLRCIWIIPVIWFPRGPFELPSLPESLLIFRGSIDGFLYSTCVRLSVLFALPYLCSPQSAQLSDDSCHPDPAMRPVPELSLAIS